MKNLHPWVDYILLAFLTYERDGRLYQSLRISSFDHVLVTTSRQSKAIYVDLASSSTCVPSSEIFHSRYGFGSGGLNVDRFHCDPSWFSAVFTSAIACVDAVCSNICHCRAVVPYVIKRICSVLSTACSSAFRLIGASQVRAAQANGRLTLLSSNLSVS